MGVTKIALLTSGIFPFQIGGIQKHSYYLAKHYARHKITVDIYTCAISNKAILKEFFSADELAYLNFIEIEFPLTKKIPGHYIYASYLFSKAFYKAVSKNNYDVIYAQGFTSWYFLRKEAFQSNLVSNLHGLEMFQTSINLKNKLEQFLLKIPAKEIIKKSRYNISLGGKLTSILYTHGASKNSVIELPNAIDKSWLIEESEILQSENKALHLLFVGRYERRKGIEEFTDVIKRTIDKVNYKVTFIGPIPEHQQISHPRVTYRGLVKETDLIKQEFLNADILVCPSYSEGMPTVILEAMASGCAIIATDVGAVNTMVNNQNGWLIKGDIVSGLEKAINGALQMDIATLNHKKRESLNRVKLNFTWEHVVNNTLSAIIKIKNN
ncbi:glycosyltransferase family 4 protein [Winogradskyella vidalii]|uniref:glycosyltransferase family 4 protein n=1 Tax=Winogradskyella vidalii TaxID=2615024 RepID=UPI0015C7D806|nr:glycosyltransferase family 4 protein [Winogradskyella vidalii]